MNLHSGIEAEEKTTVAAPSAQLEQPKLTRLERRHRGTRHGLLDEILSFFGGRAQRCWSN